MIRIFIKHLCGLIFGVLVSAPRLNVKTNIIHNIINEDQEKKRT